MKTIKEMKRKANSFTNKLQQLAKGQQKPSMSSINWTHHVWNPWMGCAKVSAACKFCYIGRMFPNAHGGVWRTKDKTWAKVYSIKKPSLIFVCNISDFFIENADIWRNKAWEVIRDNPQHTFQILTKRAERIADCLPSDWGDGYDNVWLGVTVEDDTPKVLKRLDILRKIPAKLKWVSVEPIYKEFNFTESQVKGFDWFILGGESGGWNKEKQKYEGYSRACKAKWVYQLLTTLKGYGKSVWIKQFGSQFAINHDLKSKHAENWLEFPKKYRVREFPVKGLKPRNNKY